MKPLQSVAMGLVIVALAARVDGYDVLADPLGWVLAYLGAAKLPRTVPWSDKVVLLAVLALLTSVPLWFPGVVERLLDLNAALPWLASLPQVVFIATLCAALAGAAARADPGGPSERRSAAWLRAASTLSAITVVVPVVAFTEGGAAEALMQLLALLTIVLVIVLLFRYSSRTWALPEPRQLDQTIPW